MNGPCDWDQESHCIENDCSNPATHRRLDSMVGDTPVYELVCCNHSHSGVGSLDDE